MVSSPKGPSTQIVRLQGPKTIQSMDFGTKTLLFGYLDPLGRVQDALPYPPPQHLPFGCPFLCFLYMILTYLFGAFPYVSP